MISMSGRTFIDTNVVVYAFDGADPAKRAAATAVLSDETIVPVVSTQVMNEFYVTVTRKLATPLPAEAAIEALDRLRTMAVAPIDADLVVAAAELGVRHQLNHWDALIVETAARAGCAELLSEDLAHGSTLRGVTIQNPFR